ncbi:MAG: proton-conducting transporter membrane subunit [Zestosphaera sp.]
MNEPSVGLVTVAPVLVAFMLPVLTLKFRSRILYATITTATTFFVAVLTLVNLVEVVRGNVLTYSFGGWPPPLGIVYVVDFLNGVLGFLAATLFFFSSLYMYWYFSKIESGYEWLSTLILILLAGVLGCLYTGDLFNFFVMLEVLSISSYALVAFFRRRKWAVEASMAYSFIGALATMLFFFGVIFIYASFGTVNIADLVVKTHQEPQLLSEYLERWSGKCVGEWCYGNVFISSALAVALMLWALNFEAGLFPNNYWMPSAYAESPTPASALFAGIVDKVGTYGVIRLFITLFTAYGAVLAFPLWGIAFRDFILMILSFLGLITGYLGALLMFPQKNVKRLLAYSTISHIGIIFTSFGALVSRMPLSASAEALGGILLHMITHAIGEFALFIGLGTLSIVAGSTSLAEMQGLGSRYPLLTASIILGFLSLLGVIPLAGFFSKFMIFTALMNSGLPVHALSIVLISGISALGYFKVIYTLVVGRSSEERVQRDRLIIPTLILLVLAATLVILGVMILQGAIISELISHAESLLSIDGLSKYINSVSELSKALGGG